HRPVQRVRGDAAGIALLPHDPEVSEFQPAFLADEDVHRREIAMEVLTAVQSAEHVEDARNLTTREPFREAFARSFEKRAEVAEWRVFDREAVEHAPIGTKHR